MTILIIEDDQDLAQLVKCGLAEVGYPAEIVNTGEEGVHYASGGKYDLIILDIGLPNIDGLTVCKTMRDNGINTPVIMLTAYTEIEDKVKGLDCGADDYLGKPFAFDELFARTRALLRRNTPSRSPVLSANNIQLDTISHTLKVKDKPVKLTATEYKILAYFLMNPNRLITRTMLEDHIWGLDKSHTSNVTDVYIKRLRDKLKEPSEPDIIKTFRGLGYELVKEEKPF